jgi:hypothetical protein
VTSFICTACGAEYPPPGPPPPSCPICEDPRQFVPPEGQRAISSKPPRAISSGTASLSSTPVTISHIAATLRSVTFGRPCGTFGRNISHDAQAVIERSAERYLRTIS